jgi:hypothetical protein
MRFTARGICAILLFACAGYCAWTWRRSELWDIARDPAWPRAFPYPDRFVHDLERYWDRMRPSPRGSIKMHGEFQHVQHAAGMAAIACAGAGVLFSLPTLLRMSRRGASKCPGFRIIADSDSCKPERPVNPQGRSDPA